MSNTEEYVSLFDFLGKSAGPEKGRLVYAAAKQANEIVKSKDVSNPKFTGKVLTYRRGFLETYFKTSSDDLPY